MFAHPLQWPAGWPRTDPINKADGRSTFRMEPHAIREAIYDEMRLLQANKVTISTNIPMSMRGEPYLDRKPTDGDAGVAVYFAMRGKDYVMARDYYLSPWHNLRSLTLVIAGMRQVERHGGSTMLERTFAGFAALPENATGTGWETVLGNPTTLAEAEAAYRTAAREAHPDTGGSHDRMIVLTNAITTARLVLR